MIDSEVALLLSILPQKVRENFHGQSCLGLNEVVLDLGYVPEVRWADHSERLEPLGPVSQQDIDEVTQAVGRFNGDNRAGIERTLHRISAIRNRDGKIIGITCRIGRAIEGTISEIRDIISTRKNILFLGPPGIGKTTRLRECARVISMELQRRVIVVDTSNEIAGDGDIPHPGIGYARRMQVPRPDLQHNVMIEAVENHMPQVVIVDEIGTGDEAAAARTIAERGIQLVATAHGYTLENLIKNPTLSDLIGGIQSVILGDDEAKIRGTQKTILERKNPPTFDVIIEIREKDLVAIYRDSRVAVDSILRGERVSPELRRRVESGVENQVDVAELDSALAEISTVVDLVSVTGKSVDAESRSSEVRIHQHQWVSKAGFNSVDVGPDEFRRVRVFPKV
ncbi:hypothetical protein EB093_04445 [bacterium]|nr:hypothetical protein [bacterium]